MKSLKSILLLCGCLGVTACTTFPTPDYLQKPDEGGPTVGDLVQHIQCSLSEALSELPADEKTLLTHSNYIATVDLSLKVEDIAALTPSLSFGGIPVTPPNFTLVVGGTLSGDRQNTFTGEYTIALNKFASQDSKFCALKNSPAAFDLSSDDLGIVDMLRASMEIAKYNQFQFSKGDIERAKAASQARNGAMMISEEQKSAMLLEAQVMASRDTAGVLPAKFGETVQFTVVRSGNVGPTWTLKHFKGVGGSSGFAADTVTNTDFVIFGFAPPPKKDGDAVAAARDSQSLVTQQILQNLLNANPAIP